MSESHYSMDSVDSEHAELQDIKPTISKSENPDGSSTHSKHRRLNSDPGNSLDVESDVDSCSSRLREYTSSGSGNPGVVDELTPCYQPNNGMAEDNSIEPATALAVAQMAKSGDLGPQSYQNSRLMSPMTGGNQAMLQSAVSSNMYLPGASDIGCHGYTTATSSYHYTTGGHMHHGSHQASQSRYPFTQQSSFPGCNTMPVHPSAQFLHHSGHHINSSDDMGVNMNVHMMTNAFPSHSHSVKFPV